MDSMVLISYGVDINSQDEANNCFAENAEYVLESIIAKNISTFLASEFFYYGDFESRSEYFVLFCNTI